MVINDDCFSIQRTFLIEPEFHMSNSAHWRKGARLPDLPISHQPPAALHLQCEHIFIYIYLLLEAWACSWPKGIQRTRSLEGLADQPSPPLALAHNLSPSILKPSAESARAGRGGAGNGLRGSHLPTLVLADWWDSFSLSFLAFNPPPPPPPPPVSCFCVAPILPAGL